MRVNAINNFYPQVQRTSFGHTAVPYPEYEKAYHKNTGNNIVNSFALKLSSVFSPEVKKNAREIKNEINGLYDNTDKNVKKSLSLYA